MKKNNDEFLIKGITTKKANATETVKYDKKTNQNFWINKIIDLLKNRDNMCYLNDLCKEFKDFEVFLKNNMEFLDLLNKSNKVFYDPVRYSLQLKSKYNLKNCEELKEKIKSCEFGLVEDEELFDSYPGIKNDLEKIKKENFVKVIFNEEKKFNVLFHRDCADKIEKIIIDPQYDLAIKELRRIWRDEINFYNEEPSQFVKKRHRNENEHHRKKERKRKTKLIANTHLTGALPTNLNK